MKKFCTDIFARVWAAWGLLVFILSFILIFLPSMVSYLFKDYKKGQVYFIAVSKIWMNVWLWLIACPVKVEGRAYFEKDKNYIVLFNHNSMLDVPLSAPYVPGSNKTIAKSSFAKVPVFGWFYKRGAVLVNRKDDKSRSRSFEQMKAVLAAGMHMCIYPEGTRNRTGEPLKKFYDGAFKLSIVSQKQIIPCVLTGTQKAMPVHKTFYLLPAKLRMQFLPPVSPVNETVESLKETVFQQMKTVILSQQ